MKLRSQQTVQKEYLLPTRGTTTARKVKFDSTNHSSRNLSHCIHRRSSRIGRPGYRLEHNRDPTPQPEVPARTDRTPRFGAAPQQSTSAGQLETRLRECSPSEPAVRSLGVWRIWEGRSVPLGNGTLATRRGTPPASYLRLSVTPRTLRASIQRRRRILLGGGRYGFDADDGALLRRANRRDSLRSAWPPHLSGTVAAP
eukprot:scaffold1954_cov268-Pinguiococcus_pyrenoidosus.AAC.158